MLMMRLWLVSNEGHRACIFNEGIDGQFVMNPFEVDFLESSFDLQQQVSERASVTGKKLPNVNKSCPKIIPLEK